MVIRYSEVYKAGVLVARDPYEVSDEALRLENQMARRREIRRVIRARLADATPLTDPEIQQGFRLIMEYLALVSQEE